MVHLLQSTIVSNSFYCVDCIHHTLAILPTSHNFWLMFANQLWAGHFGTWLIAKLFYSVQKKLRTCGADFKYYKVAGLQLRISRSRKLRTCGYGFKNPVTSLRTCGCGLRKLKFGCGFADLKKKLAVPSTAHSPFAHPNISLWFSGFTVHAY